MSQPDGNLLITPKIESDEFTKEIEIDTDIFNDVSFLFRALIGAYIMGYSRIVISSSKRFEPSIRDSISKFTQIAIGPEIIEESNNIIIIKDLLNPKEMPFEKTIKRMYILASSMHEDAITALKVKNEDLAEEIIKRDDEIDRLHWLIGRQSHIVLRDIILSQKMGIKLEDAYHYQQMSKFLERIGDHAVKMAKNVISIIKHGIKKDMLEKIMNASRLSIKLLNNSIDAWREKDIKKANQNIQNISNLIIACEEITLNPNHIDIDLFINVSYIIESIRRTGEYAGDISEIIINNLIGT